jgi:hypothetical protein
VHTGCKTVCLQFLVVLKVGLTFLSQSKRFLKYRYKQKNMSDYKHTILHPVYTDFTFCFLVFLLSLVSTAPPITRHARKMV